MVDTAEFVTVGSNERWRVARMGALSGKFFGLTMEQLPEWHSALCRLDQTWRIIRMLYGVHPVVIPAGTDWRFASLTKQGHVRELFGRLTRRHLEDRHVDAALAAWVRALRVNGRAEQRGI